MKLKITAFALAAALMLAACTPTPAPAPAPAPATPAPAADPVAEPIDDDIAAASFILAHASPEDTVTGLFSERFADLVDQLSGGAMSVDVFPNSQLGGDVEIFTNLGVGQIDFIVGTTAPQVGTIPRLAIFDTPNAFETAEIARRVFEDPAFMDMIRAEYAASGYLLLGFADQFYRAMSSNVRIDTMADFNGVRIRTLENPFHISYWQALGASPTPMAFAEVFVGLQQGTIDAQENPYEVIVSAGFYEVQNYIINTNHLLHLISLVANDANFRALSPAQQQVIEQAAAEAIPWARNQADVRVADREAIIQASGSTVLDLSPELLADILAAIAPVHEEIRQAVGDELYNAFMAAIERAS